MPRVGRPLMGEFGRHDLAAGFAAESYRLGKLISPVATQSGGQENYKGDDSDRDKDETFPRHIEIDAWISWSVTRLQPTTPAALRKHAEHSSAMFEINSDHLLNSNLGPVPLQLR
jgi:hypothetical protein